MIKLVENLPDHVVGIVGSGKITGQDYKTVFIPALEAAMKKYPKVNVLYVLADDYAGFTPGAMWDDTREGMLHIHAWGRVAMVCEGTLLKNLVKALGFVMPLSVRTYAPSDIEAAREWVAGKDEA
ncbi:MAG: STAS/SEC14 domain-containing protein [Victivallaceae bacterium]|nr:STAS/SEC14 domain-containing protein [Victivallaceae bacterium]